ncbi:hypothetical protein KEM56_006274, partial [Ascosphaera pollenicola]
TPATSAFFAETKPIERVPSVLTTGGVTDFVETKPVSGTFVPLLASAHESAGTEPVERAIHYPALTHADKAFAHTPPTEKKVPVLSYADKTYQETPPLAKQPDTLTIARVHEHGHVSTEPVKRRISDPTLETSQIKFQSTVPVEGKPMVPLGAGEHEHTETVPIEGERQKTSAALFRDGTSGLTAEFARSELTSAETKPHHGSGGSNSFRDGALGTMAGAAGVFAGKRVLDGHSNHGQDDAAHILPEFSLSHSGTSQHASTAPVHAKALGVATARSQPIEYTTTSSISSVETPPATASRPKVAYVHASPVGADLSFSETKPVQKRDYTYTPELGISVASSVVETVPVEKKVYVDIPELSLSGTQRVVETAPVKKTDYTPQVMSSGVQYAVETAPTEKEEQILELSASSVESVETVPVSTEQPLSKYVNSIVSSVETEPVEARRNSPAYTTSDVTLIETVPIAAVKPVIALNKSDTHKFAETSPLPPAVAEPTFNICRSELQCAETSPVTPSPAVPAPIEKAITLGFSGVTFAHTKPVSHQTPKPLPVQLHKSEIQSQGTETLLPQPIQSQQAVVPLEQSTVHGEETIPTQADEKSGGWLGSASGAVTSGAAALGPKPSSINSAPSEESRSRPVTAMRDADETNAPFELPHSTNIGTEARTSDPKVQMRDIETSENATQTIVTSQLIDQLLIERHNARSASASASVAGTPSASTPVLTSTVSNLAVPEEDAGSSTHTTPKANATHSRTNSGLSQDSHRADHPYMSLATNQSRVSLAHSLAPKVPVAHSEHKPSPPQPSPQLQSQFGTALIGPTYRLSGRPLTPVIQQQQQYGTALVSPTYRVGERPSTPADPTNRRNPHTPSTIRRASQPSHRSSLSSFGSVDHRADGGAQNHGGYTFESGTDPRMIQAITQTMIGEWLWKYTRNLGRTGLSSTRHQRYVWVHPYTRTLYWSTHDPQADGSQHNSKSIPIESVREVEDENPYPPGVCSKSLEIVTPARTVKFTAQTSQRHETWYNALRYLLLRTTPEEENGREQVEQASMDISTMNPTLRSPARTHNSLRMSASSRNVRRSNSRTGTPTSRRTNSVRGSNSIRAPSFLSHPDANSLRAKRNTSTSRLSSLFHQHTHVHAGKAGSFRTRRVKARPSTADMANPHSMSADTQARPSLETSMLSSHEYPASLLSAADLEGLENVRACCGGKHDVGSLCRPHPRHDRGHSDGR